MFRDKPKPEWNMNHEWTRNEEKWISRTEIKKRYKLTNAQILLGINKGLLRCEQRTSIYNKTFDLIPIVDIEKNLDKLKSFKIVGGYVKNE